MMSLDPETSRVCNFFLEAPDWVQHEVERNDQLRRLPKKLARIPDQTGVYWIGGVVILPDKGSIPAVLVTDTDAGGELLRTFWRVNEKWYEQTDPELSDALQTSKLFPYDYRFNVPLERDIFHE